MNNDIDDRLRMYRPAAPPPELRGRVLRATLVAWPFSGRVSRVARPSVPTIVVQGRDRVREWLPAALAASVAILFYVLASSARASVSTNFVSVDRAREAMVADLASQLGGDEAAKEEAARLIQLSEDASRADAERAISAGAEVPGQ